MSLVIEFGGQLDTALIYTFYKVVQTIEPYPFFDMFAYAIHGFKKKQQQSMPVILLVTVVMAKNSTMRRGCEVSGDWMIQALTAMASDNSNDRTEMMPMTEQRWCQRQDRGGDRIEMRPMTGWKWCQWQNRNDASDRTEMMPISEQKWCHVCLETSTRQNYDVNNVHAAISSLQKHIGKYELDPSWIRESTKFRELDGLLDTMKQQVDFWFDLK